MSTTPPQDPDPLSILHTAFEQDDHLAYLLALPTIKDLHAQWEEQYLFFALDENGIPIPTPLHKLRIGAFKNTSVVYIHSNGQVELDPHDPTAAQHASDWKAVKDRGRWNFAGWTCDFDKLNFEDINIHLDLELAHSSFQCLHIIQYYLQRSGHTSGPPPTRGTYKKLLADLRWLDGNDENFHERVVLARDGGLDTSTLPNPVEDIEPKNPSERPNRSTAFFLEMYERNRAQPRSAKAKGSRRKLPWVKIADPRVRPSEDEEMRDSIENHEDDEDHTVSEADKYKLLSRSGAILSAIANFEGTEAEFAVVADHFGQLERALGVHGGKQQKEKQNAGGISTGVSRGVRGMRSLAIRPKQSAHGDDFKEGH